MDFTFWDLIWACVIFFTLGAIFPLLGVTLGGVFVLRAKSAYEPLLPPLRQEQTTGAVNLDDHAPEETPTTLNFDAEIEKLFKARSEEDPISKAHNRMKEQLNG